MAGPKLDNAGAVKMKTLEEALAMVQTLHGLVERYAVDVKRKMPASTFPQQFKRQATPLVGQLKGQFGMISDQVAAMILAATRGGGGDQGRLRALREGVAQVRTALEIMQTRVKEQHTVVEPAEGTTAS